MAETGLVEWIRHYKRLLVLCVLLGVATGALFRVLIPRQYEVASVLIETSGAIAPRNLGPIAIALFRSAAVYDLAVQELDTPALGRSFLDESAEVRPVAGTNVLLIVGRSESLATARAISLVMTEALQEAAAERADFLAFDVFQGPRQSPIAAGASNGVVIVFGATAGLWAGMALALFHYRYKRPVLSLRRALDLSGATFVILVQGRRRGWAKLKRRLGAPGPIKESLSQAFAPSSALAHKWEVAFDVVGDPALAVDLTRVTQSDGIASLREDVRRLVIVAAPSTDCRELSVVRAIRDNDPARTDDALVWVR